MKTIRQLLLLTALLLLFTSYAIGQETAPFSISATGTGQTTGHIATLSVKNTSDSPISIVATGKGGVDAFSIITPSGNEIGLFSEESTVLKYPNGRGKFNVGGSKVHIPSFDGRHQGYVSGDIRPAQPSATPYTAGDVVNWIPPGGEMAFHLDGYCADIHLPPVPNGGTMPDVSDWIHSNDVAYPTADQLNAVGAYPRNPAEHDGYSITNIPDGTPLASGGSMVIPKPNEPSGDYSQVVAPYLFDALDRIQTTVDVLQANNVIQTPFTSAIPDGINHERETLIQQSLWIYAGALSGEDYTKDDFADRMTDQYESSTGTKINKAPAETQDKLQTGIDDFWNAFELVGASAKVYSGGSGDEDDVRIVPDSKKDEIEKAIEKAYNEQKDPMGSSENVAEAGRQIGSKAVAKDAGAKISGSGEDQQPQSEGAHVNQEENENPDVTNNADDDDDADDEDEEKKRCRCSSIDFQVKTVKGDADSFDDITPEKTNNTVSSDADNRGQFGATAEEIEIDNEYNLEKGDKLSVKISDIELSCDCDGADCPDIHARSTETGLAAASEGKTTVKHSADQNKILVFRKRKTHKATQTTDNAAIFEFVADNNNKKVTETLFFLISAWCSSDDCSRDFCVYKFKLKIRINQ